MVPEKVGLKHVQGDGLEYEITLVFGLKMKNMATASKHRTGLLYSQPESNMNKLKSFQCDMIGCFGSLDLSSSPEMVQEFEKKGSRQKKKHTTYKQETGHGFTNSSNLSCNSPASEDVYGKAIRFLKVHGCSLKFGFALTLMGQGCLNDDNH